MAALAVASDGPYVLKRTRFRFHDADDVAPIGCTMGGSSCVMEMLCSVRLGADEARVDKHVGDKGV